VKTQAAFTHESVSMQELILYVFCGASIVLTITVAVIAVCHFQKYNRRFRAAAGLSTHYITTTTKCVLLLLRVFPAIEIAGLDKNGRVGTAER